MVKLASFDLYHANNVICLTFRKNFRIFDRKEDFRDELKEDKRSNEVQGSENKQIRGRITVP